MLRGVTTVLECHLPLGSPKSAGVPVCTYIPFPSLLLPREPWTRLGGWIWEALQHTLPLISASALTW